MNSWKTTFLKDENWKGGWSLDEHTTESRLLPDGSFDNKYSELGGLLHETKYPKQRLLKLINDKPWSSDDYTDDMSEVEKNFEDHYKEYVESNCHNFDKSKITLVKTNIEELVDQEELDKYVNKTIDEIVEDGELMWRPDISDYIDPKDD